MIHVRSLYSTSRCAFAASLKTRTVHRYALASHTSPPAHTLRCRRSIPARTLTTSSSPTEKLPGSKHEIPLSTVDERHVHVGWDPLTWSRFHHIWLRDHCRCPECFHPQTKQRLVNTFEIPPNIQPSAIESTAEGLRVTWPNSHQSLFPWHWLKYNSYSPAFPEDTSNTSSEKLLWGADISNAPPTIAYDAVMAEEKAVFEWLDAVDKFGFCFVSGVPPTTTDTENMTKRIAHIRETQYGGFWEFTSDLAKGDTAYTTLALQGHTDTTYYTDPAGLQLFHLLSHTNGSGGATLLVDGFRAASLLRVQHPEYYKLLSTVKVPTYAAGEARYLYKPSPRPILVHVSEDGSGALVQVRYNNDDRSVLRTVHADEVEEWYAALRKWHEFLTGKDAEYWVQLKPGTAVVIDNHRVLHGRSAFDGRRRMCGAYVGMDDYRARLTVLRVKFGTKGSGVEEGVWSRLF